MFGALRRGLGGIGGFACFRLAYTPVAYKKLDEDRISNPVERNSNSGVDRVMKIFDRDENGTISPEASFVSISTFTGGFIGAIYGGLLTSRIANLSFRESNEATVYYSQKAAARELLDKTTIGFAKGVVTWGARYSFFCFSFVGLSTVLSKFRGESGVLEYSLGGMVTGAIYKFGLGPKGMVAGGFFGGLIGTFGGLMLYITSKLSGITMDDAYNLSKLYYQSKDYNFHGAQRHTEEPDIIIQTYHPYGTQKKNTLDDVDDIRDVSELKYNKNTLPKDIVTSNNVNSSPDKK
ncbi:RPII140-upstream gene protein-like isoform X1 [Sitodiplosis mosellana]|uniref:RPII140-upstream gene protein-like isoform X1 n=1 Tax=Sitodiplosis mosellana TaxID=263140 RepID=UPI0024441AE5|nr:RPII140-upstream gene protein-like isoform X1 [Sitodiplosis mosellana]